MGILDYFKSRRNGPVVINFVHNVENVITDMDAADLYDTQDALRAVVDFIARSVASTSAKVYRRGEDDSRERDRESTTAKLIASPNSHMTTYDLIDTTVHELKLYGEHLWLVVQDLNRPSGWAIEPIRHGWIYQTETDGFETTRYLIGNPVTGISPRWIDAENTVAFTVYQAGGTDAFQPDRLSPVSPLKAILREQIEAWRFRNQIWDNNGRMTAYISRPQFDKEADWTPAQRDRFIKAWKENYTGKGKRAGGMPLLEDGMKIESVTFNAREHEWSEALKLSRESVAGVYHINPAQIWSSEGQTYASVKENARALYVDCLGPDFAFIQQTINHKLVPMLGDDPEEVFFEFDVFSKLNGSFEEQASVLSTMIGAPYMTVNEGRKRLNLPLADDPDCDKLVKPLNVIYGGQPSPQTPLADGSDAKSASSADIIAKYAAEELLRSFLQPKQGQEAITEPETKKAAITAEETPVQLPGEARIDDVMEMTDFLRGFFKRQGKSIVSAIDRARDKGQLPRMEHGELVVPDMTRTEMNKILQGCFDFGRWNKELAHDLEEMIFSMAATNTQEMMDRLDADPERFSEKYVQTYSEDTAEALAKAINGKTYEELKRAVFEPDSFDEENAQKATPQGVFAFAEDKRASDLGQSAATNIRGWGQIAGVHLSGKQKHTYKVWHTSGGNVRKEHALMNGERIPYANPDWEEDENSPNYRKSGYGEHNRFSNGCRWPGDFSKDPHQVAGCKCFMTMEVSL